MNTESDSVNSEMPGQVDRLVCGELDETARKELLEWLEADPVRWRMCGVAFLEVQTWSRAIERSSARAEHSGASAVVVERPSTRRPSVRGKAFIRQATVVAAVLIAFGSGFACRNFSRSGSANG